MKRLELTSADGTSIAGYQWEPDGVAHTDVLLVHGLAEHMGRYDYVAETLNKSGYRVTGLDLRGHGHSAGKRGHVTRWSDYTEDVTAAANAIGGPHILMAHSMGGLVALDYLRGNTPTIAAAVSAPLLGIAVHAPVWKTTAGRILSRIIPGLSMTNELDARLICSDEKIVEAYKADPLVFSTITPRWFTEMTAALKRVHLHTRAYDTPLYLLYGTEDKIVSVEAIEDFAKIYPTAVVRPWEGLYHEVLNELVRGKVLEEIVEWMNPYSKREQKTA